MLRAILVTAALAGCASPPDPHCGSPAGLDVSVDLSASPCDRLSDPSGFTVQAMFGNAKVDQTAATMTFDGAAHHVDYVFAWPAGVGDGSFGSVTWSGEGVDVGGWDEDTFTVHRDACVVVDLTAACGVPVDAGP